MAERISCERNMSTVLLSELKKMASDAFSRFTKNDWTGVISHVRKRAKYYWKRDGLMEDQTYRLNTNHGWY
jgi:hypothetical protein